MQFGQLRKTAEWISLVIIYLLMIFCLFNLISSNENQLLIYWFVCEYFAEDLGFWLFDFFELCFWSIRKRLMVKLIVYGFECSYLGLKGGKEKVGVLIERLFRKRRGENTINECKRSMKRRWRESWVFSFSAIYLVGFIIIVVAIKWNFSSVQILNAKIYFVQL